MSVREARGETGRERLLRAAKELFWRYGYESTSPQRIYEHSGTGQGSFYHHFANKLALGNAAIGEIARDELGLLAAIEAATDDPLERLERFLSAPRDGERGCKLGRFVYEPSVAHEEIREPISGYFTALERFLEANVAAAQARGALATDVAPGVLASLLLTSVQGGYLLARAHDDRAELDDAIAAARALLARMRT